FVDEVEKVRVLATAPWSWLRPCPGVCCDGCPGQPAFGLPPQPIRDRVLLHVLDPPGPGRGLSGRRVRFDRYLGAGQPWPAHLGQQFCTEVSGEEAEGVAAGRRRVEVELDLEGPCPDMFGQRSARHAGGQCVDMPPDGSEA